MRRASLIARELIVVYRLVVHTAAGEVRHVLANGANVVGSGADCTVRIPEPTVSRQHAVLHVSPDRLEVEDLGSRNGTLVSGQRLAGRRPVAIDEEVAFGGVLAVIESVPDGELEAAVVLDPPQAQACLPERASAGTDAAGSLLSFALEVIPELVERLASGSDLGSMARAVGAGLYETLPCLAVEIVDAGGRGGVLFTAARSGRPDSGCSVEARAAQLSLRVHFPGTGQARTYGRAVAAAARLVAAAGPSTTGEQRHGTADAPPLPDPPTVVPTVRRVFVNAARVARGDVSVLITGESGTGKEVLARYVHAASPRREGPFVALNCAALPRDLLEAELFGIEKGVATGVESRPGKFELAHEGTLFLDEIGDMPAEVQAKILRVLQEGSVYRLGGREPRPARVRIVSATNRDLDALLEAGAFRTDLYHRIADWRVTLPPLRERRADIPSLAAHFLAREGARAGVRPGGISRTALEALQRCPWPGNVRQLEREMATAALFLGDSELLETRHLQPAVVSPPSGCGTTLQEQLEEAERRAIAGALARHDGDTAAAAMELDMGRSTLYRRIKELGVAGPGTESPG